MTIYHTFEELLDRSRMPNAGALREICAKYYVSRLKAFGSVLHGSAHPESDLDIIVEFKHGKTPGFGFAELASELSAFYGLSVDLHTSASLSKYFKDDVLQEAKEIYVAEE